MIRHGSAAFTEDDARATLRHGLGLIDLLTDGLDPAALVADSLRIEQARARVQAAVDDADAPLVERLGVVVEARDEVARAVRASGALGPAAQGTVAHLALGAGGVPKTGRERIDVGWDGVAGDRQADRRNHGRPWQAVCLWSSEVIDGFVADGHPIGPGRAGENVTVAGLPWDRVRPGSVLELGEVVLDVWAPAVPCRKNARWFADGRSDRMHHRHGPVSRLYAAVVQPGAIAVGDVVHVHRDAGATPALSVHDRLGPDVAAQVRTLLDLAFDDLTDDDWRHALGGQHVLGVLPDGEVVAHAAVVPRTIHVGDRALRAGYVEAVATAPTHQGHGVGGRIVGLVGDLVRARHEVGVLSTGRHPFYERLGWERWRGPTFVRRPDGLARTEEDDDGVMVLRTDATAGLDLTLPIACEERPGDDW